MQAYLRQGLIIIAQVDGFNKFSKGNILTL